MPFTCVGEQFPLYQFAATGAPYRRTQPDRQSDIINVKDWGAKGDALTDDFASIQAAINFAIGPRADGSKGGRVFFPGGHYNLIASTVIAVGSSDNTVSVDLVGAAHRSVFIDGGISKGTNTYDNIGRVEGLTLTGIITLSGASQMVIDCQCSIDASAAVGTYIADCSGQAGEQTADSVTPGPTVGTFGLALGSYCTAINCRYSITDISFMMGGNGGCLVGCSSEHNRVGVRMGWLPSFALGTVGSPSSGNTITFASLTNAVIVGRYVTGTNIPANTFITAINTSTNTITLNNPITGLVSSVTFANETPSQGQAVLTYEGERNGTYIDMYNCNGCYVTGTNMQGQVTSEPDPGNGVNPIITSISWSGGVATVTCARNHNQPAGMQILQMYGAPNAWYPAYHVVGWIIATFTSDATHFTYDLPVNPGSPNPINNTANPGLGWIHAQLYCMRFRKVHNSVIMGNGAQANVALASLDFEYAPGITDRASAFVPGQGQAQHGNNILWGITFNYGIQMPTTNTQNRAGWSIKGAGGPTNPLEGHGGWTGVSTVGSFVGLMNVADLPNSTSGPYQFGPFEGQEFDIKDSTLAASGNFAAVVVGGGSNHVKVRYGGSPLNWRIVG
jgi:hypothetical protein